MSENRQPSSIRSRIAEIFGDPTDPISLVEQRAAALLKDRKHIVWEGDASTFEFLYVSPSAEEMLGYPVERWTKEPTFWSDVVIHPEDRESAVAYCALASGQGRHHDFVYRARAADGRTVWLHDYVRVVKGRYNLAAYLRGVMVPLPAASRENYRPGILYANPSLEALQSSTWM